MKAEKPPLNSAQQKLATDYHNLIYTFLHQNGLSVEEWYDVAAIAFVEAVRDHDPNSGFSITTFAFRYMRFAIIREIRRANTEKRKANIISMDSYPCGENFFLHDVIPNLVNVETQVVSKICAEEFVLQLTAKQRAAVLPRMYGLSFSAAAKKEKVSVQALYLRIKKLSKQLTKNKCGGETENG